MGTLPLIYCAETLAMLSPKIKRLTVKNLRHLIVQAMLRQYLTAFIGLYLVR
jgi:hypothetical protein